MYIGYIYRHWITNEEEQEKSYIGQVSSKQENIDRNYKNRWANGKGYGKEQTKFTRAIKKYGWDNFKHSILLKIECKTYEELDFWLDEWEKYYIWYYDSYYNGYNCTLGGKGYSVDYKPITTEEQELIEDTLSYYYNNDIRKMLKEKMTILEHYKLNYEELQTGNKKYKNFLTHHWFKNNEDGIIKLKKHIHNFIANITHAKSKDLMWTTYDDMKDELTVKGSAKGYSSLPLCSNEEIIPKNDDKRHYLIYLCNRRFHYGLFKNFDEIEIDEDILALSEMLQWIWRSAIRNGEEVYIYIPSKRMRDLLIDWMNEELYDFN